MKRVAAIAAGLAAVALAAPAAASAQGAPCPEYAGATCTTVTVPLDRSGRVPGTVNLAVAKVPARVGPSRGTLFFLAGGPGQAALPALESFAQLAAKLAPNYDLVTFDQRGTGRSGLLRCSALSGNGSVIGAYARCGAQLGAGRGFYRTTDSVDDIEAVRTALGAGPLALFGVSYGGRVAGEYVRRYPGSVSRMVLDSPSTLKGTDPFSVSSQRALPRVFSALCARGACRSFTRHPYTDLSRLASQLRKKRLAAKAIGPSGRAFNGRLSVDDLFRVVFLSDLDPVARAELPSAVRAARRGDGAPLARALVRALATGGAVAKAQSDEDVSDEVFAATSCSEGPLPWAANSPANSGRDKAAVSRLRQLGSRAFRPFTADTVVAGNAILTQCLRWPPVTPPAPVSSRGPAVPTLVLSGQEDIRTPLASAQRIAAEYPGGRVLQIPGWGHSTILSDITLCAVRANFSFLTTGVAPRSCRFSRPIKVAPLPPRRLGDVHAKSSRARVARAVDLTVRDAARQVPTAPSPRFGGLRGGRAEILSGDRVRLVSYQYVPGLRVSGTLRVRSGHLVGKLTARGGGLTRVVHLSRDSKGRVTGASAASVAAGDLAPVAIPTLPDPVAQPATPAPGHVSRFLRQAAGQ